MNVLTKASRIARSKGDPRILSSGPSLLAGADQLARAIGWCSIGLGLSQLLAAPRYTRALGIEGKEAFVRACGVRELAHGIVTLSTERKAGLWSRVGGDALDIAMLGAATQDNPKRGNVALALALVIGVTVLDVIGAQRVTARHTRGREHLRDFRDRSGFPKGIERARGAAADLKIAAQISAERQLAGVPGVSGRTSKDSEALLTSRPPSPRH
jgi:hypothetical protein